MDGIFDIHKSPGKLTIFWVTDYHFNAASSIEKLLRNHLGAYAEWEIEHVSLAQLKEDPMISEAIRLGGKLVSIEREEPCPQ